MQLYHYFSCIPQVFSSLSLIQEKLLFFLHLPLIFHKNPLKNAKFPLFSILERQQLLLHFYLKQKIIFILFHTRNNQFFTAKQLWFLTINPYFMSYMKLFILHYFIQNIQYLSTVKSYAQNDIFRSFLFHKWHFLFPFLSILCLYWNNNL